MAETDPLKYFKSEVKRLNYYNSQFLKEDDFSDEQLYHCQMRYLHNRSLHTWGVASGLEVKQASGKKVTVSAGTAIDRLGQEIVLTEDTSVPRDNALPEEGDALSFDDFEAGASVYLVIRYRKLFDQADKDTQSQSKLYTRTTERPQLSLSAAAPAADSPDVVLAVIKLDTNKNIAEVGTELRRFAGSRIGAAADGADFGVYADSRGNWHFFDGSKNADRLTVDSAGNVGVGTQSPAVRLAVNGPGTNVYGTDLWVEQNQHVQGNETMAQGGGRGRLRVGTAWKYAGIFTDKTSTDAANDLVLGASSGVVRIGPGADSAQNLIVPNGKVGVGNSAPNFPLSFPDTLGAKISLWGQSGNHYGIGIQSTLLQIYTDVAGADVAFGYGSSDPFTETMRVRGNGNVGIGTPQPAGRLNISEAKGTAHNPNSGTLVIDHEDSGGASSIVFRSKVNRTSDYGYIQYQDADKAGGTGESARLIVGISNDADDHLILQSSGNVGIGTMTPRQKLEVAGDLQLSGNRSKIFYRGDADNHIGSLAFYSPDGGKTAIITPYDGKGNNLDKSVVSLGGRGGFESNVVSLNVSGNLDVAGAANIWTDSRYAVPNNFMALGSLTIGSTTRDYGGGSNWSGNTAGLLLEAKDNTEIAVHDAGTRLTSLMYYEGAATNRLTIGRDMGWGALSILSLNASVGIGTASPAGTLNISEATGKRHNPNSGTLVIDHEDSGGASSIVFRSRVNRTSDYGFIQYQDAAAVGAGGESARLIIGISNDADDHLILQSSGNVGIGTMTPQVPLEVSGSRSFPLNASPDGFGPNTGFTNWGDHGKNFDLSILASGWIAGAGIVANSDRRIKEVVGRSDTARDLEIIRNLRVTDYRPLDKMAEGNALRKGFIAQEVVELLPQAVGSRRNVIPDIYSRAAEFAFDRGQKTLSVTLSAGHGLAEGEAVQILTEDGARTVKVVAVTSPHSFITGPFEKEPEQVFVYGREVDDFLAVDYDQIFSTAVGALQELKREQDSETKALWAEIAELKAANVALTARLRRLEPSPETTPATAAYGRNGSNGNGR